MDGETKDVEAELGLLKPGCLLLATPSLPATAVCVAPPSFPEVKSQN